MLITSYLHLKIELFLNETCKTSKLGEVYGNKHSFDSFVFREICTCKDTSDNSEMIKKTTKFIKNFYFYAIFGYFVSYNIQGGEVRNNQLSSVVFEEKVEVLL